MYKTTQRYYYACREFHVHILRISEMYIICFRIKLVFIIIVLYSVFTEQYISCPWTRNFDIMLLYWECNSYCWVYGAKCCIGISTPKSTQNVDLSLSLFLSCYLFIYRLPLYMHAVEKFSVYVYVYVYLSFDCHEGEIKIHNKRKP